MLAEEMEYMVTAVCEMLDTMLGWYMMTSMRGQVGRGEKEVLCVGLEQSRCQCARWGRGVESRQEQDPSL
jgi:hypothetical protein